MTTPSEADQRILVTARLRPIGATAFQPTGFPNLGAAEFKRPTTDGPDVDCLLVESVQSMTNRIEELCWDSVAAKPAHPLEGLPYVEVATPAGEHLTSSREEPHRLASAYIRNATIDGTDGVEWISDRLGLAERRRTDWQAIYRAVFEMDPMCLLHGVFFSDKKWSSSGNPKIRRAVTAVIEAHDVRRAISGGVKRDDVQFTKAEGAGAEEGFGFVPFGRTEFTAAEIVLSVVIDIGQIRGYGLSDDQTRLLIDIAQWEAAKLVGQPLRLRTACDLEVADSAEVAKPRGYSLPEVDELEERIAAAIDSVEPVKASMELK